MEMMTKAHKASNIHTPADHIKVEATDDSYLFALTLTTLQRLCLEAERFQYVYRWITQWSKTKAFVICPDGTPPATVSMLSITIAAGVHPWNISRHEVPLKAGELEFLRTKVDDPGW